MTPDPLFRPRVPSDPRRERPVAAPVGRRLLRCDGCGWAVECTPDDEPRFLKAGCIVCRQPVRPEPAAAETPALRTQNKRLGRRRPPRPGARAEVRRGGLGLGPDLAAGLVDVSEGGVGVRLKAPAAVREEVEVVLGRPAGGKPLRGLAEVRWCCPAGDGTYRAGVRLRRRLTHADLLDLCR